MLNYKILGKGDIKIILLHGFLENIKMWSKLTDSFPNEYQIIEIDLPGHGKSKSYSSVHSMEFMAEKVIEVLDKLNIDKFIPIGHSMGGYVTLALADLYIDRLNGFVLLNSTTLEDNEAKKEQRLKAAEVIAKNYNSFIDLSIPNLFMEENKIKMSKEIQEMKVIAKETSIKGIEGALRGMRERIDRTFIFNKFEKPIEIIIGKYDKSVSPEDFLKVIPSKSNIYTDELESAHMSLFETPEKTIKIINVFIKKCLV